MRVLLLNQFFWPDLAATSQLLTDLASHLAAQHHDVTVICGCHAYGGKDCIECPPVNIVRVVDWPFARGRLARPLSYISFFAGAAWRALRIPKPDIVISLTTPPLLSVVGLLVQKLRGAQHQIWEMDLYPDVAIDLQVLRAGSVLTLITGAVADFVRRRANRIIVLGECMRTRLQARGIPANQIAVAENWADGRLLYPAGEVAAKVLTVMYPGNLGLAHEVDTLAGAMRELGNHAGIRFLFVGGGPRFKSLQQFCESRGITNASFLPYCSRDRLNQLMAAVQVGLATQTDACLGSLVPSKIYSLIAAGLPLLFIGPAGSTAANLIRRFDCGWHIACGDSGRLSRLLASLADNRDEVRETGRRARQAFLENYDRPIGVERICRLMGMPASVESG